MAEWIWYPGEYELYHSMLLHSRRQEFGADYPCFWLLPSIYPNVEFHRDFDCKESGSFKLYTNGKGYLLLDGVRYPANTDVAYGAGKHHVMVLVTKTDGLPAAFIEGKEIYTDGGWEARYPFTLSGYPAGRMEAYAKPTDNVEIFPFAYEALSPVSVSDTEGGKLYDYGCETFCKLVLSGVSSPLDIVYGESIEEATDRANALVYEDNVTEDVTLPPRAFRYIAVKGRTQPKEIKALYEYQPLEYKASFECDDPIVKKVFDVCAYTFHLNTREFFLDGIKRDRWVWSGDAYQSYMVNRYLFADEATAKRTMIALVGKPPYVQHINGINDYSFYQMIGIWEYLQNTGDTEFIKFIYPRLYELYKFCVSRLDENGFVTRVENDWIFIDWSDHLDKGGAMCAEQILLWRATQCMKELAAAIGAGCECAVDTDELKNKIYECYYRPEMGGFIDAYGSGREIINRQQNVFAILYDFTSTEEAEKICERVLDNDAIPPITTPYFELYELMALCKMGRVERVQKMLVSYWGEMLKLGATSVWEQFDPTNRGTEHYAMYGSNFGKSLCHAWGAGPVFILGRYIAGVEVTGADSFRIAPQPGIYNSFSARVPVGDRGYVTVKYNGYEFAVKTDVSGGVFEYGGAYTMLEPNEEIKISI